MFLKYCLERFESSVFEKFVCHTVVVLGNNIAHTTALRYFYIKQKYIFLKTYISSILLEP